jgi:hypothetical protein
MYFNKIIPSPRPSKWTLEITTANQTFCPIQATFILPKVTVQSSVLPGRESIHIGRVFTLAVLNRKYKFKTRKYLINANKYSVVGIATGDGLDGLGIESRLGVGGGEARSPAEPRLALIHIQPLIQWEPDLSLEWSGRGVALTTHPPSSAGVKERVHIYIYI